ncbi:MAG: PTS sugar transporter subunit IIA, partial [Mariprofundaceae bacterium]
MIGIVLIGHNRIASEMLAAVEHVVGEQPLMQALDVRPDTEPEELHTALQARIQGCDVGHGVLVLADMFGGTPCNVAMGCFRPGRVEVISGFNLPLLIKAVALRGEQTDLLRLAERVLAAGRQYMCLASHVAGAGSGCRPAGED